MRVEIVDTDPCNLCSRDDVRSSIDLLDRVIADFDDGLTSGAESDAAGGGGRSNNHARNGNVNKRNGGVRLQQQRGQQQQQG